jgi:hypothetical protein
MKVNEYIEPLAVTREARQYSSPVAVFMLRYTSLLGGMSRLYKATCTR